MRRAEGGKTRDGGQSGLRRASGLWSALGPPLAMEDAGGPLEAAEQGWHGLSSRFLLIIYHFFF